MTTTTTQAPVATTPAAHAPFLRRLRHLLEIELRLLLRNAVNVMYAVAMGPLMVLLLANLPHIQAQAKAMPQGGLTTMLTALLVINSLGIGIYYNLTTVTVARREALVLKRLRSGASSAFEILVALVSPNLLIMLVSTGLVLALCCAALGAPRFANPVALALGLLLGCVLFALLGLITGASTRTVESAQMTTMPGIMLSLFLSGLLIPLAVMPENMQMVMQLLPVAPVVDLLMIGLNGTTLDGQALSQADTWGQLVQPTVVLLAWCAAGVWLLQRTMKWEPVR